MVKKKPIYTVFGDFGIKKEFVNKKLAEKYAESHNGVVAHTGWKKLKKVM